MTEIERQLVTLPTREIAGVAWKRLGEVAVVEDDDAAIALSDQYAPEHLEVQTRRNDYYLSKLRNYGSLFLGEESTVAYGDKGVGTNHTLPTGRAGRYTGGLWVGKFLKTVTYQRLTPEASQRIAPVIGRMCAAEGMLAHELTATVRVERYAQAAGLSVVFPALVAGIQRPTHGRGGGDAQPDSGRKFDPAIAEHKARDDNIRPPPDTAPRRHPAPRPLARSTSGRRRSRPRRSRCSRRPRPSRGLSSAR